MRTIHRRRVVWGGHLTRTLADRYGPNWRSIEFVREVQVPLLTTERARLTLANLPHAGSLMGPEKRAFESARHLSSREEQTVRASEDLRKSLWNVVWDGSSWSEAWRLSWLLARTGLGLATVDLIDGYYDVTDYIDLVGPWATGFKDHPIPRESITS